MDWSAIGFFVCLVLFLLLILGLLLSQRIEAKYKPEVECTECGHQGAYLIVHEIDDGFSGCFRFHSLEYSCRHCDHHFLVEWKEEVATGSEVMQ